MKKKYYTWVTLVGEIETEDPGKAFDWMMDQIEHRDGLEMSSHEIIEAAEEPLDT